MRVDQLGRREHGEPVDGLFQFVPGPLVGTVTTLRGSGQGVGVRAKDSVVDDGPQVRYRCGRGMDGGMLASDEGECERLHVDDVPR